MKTAIDFLWNYLQGNKLKLKVVVQFPDGQHWKTVPMHDSLIYPLTPTQAWRLINTVDNQLKALAEEFRKENYGTNKD